MGERVNTTIRCESCPLYQNPMKILEYPNCDNEKIGWVQCGAGNTVKSASTACYQHPLKRVSGQPVSCVIISGEETGARHVTHKLMDVVDKMSSEERKKLKVVEKPDGLLGGNDFGASLLADIERMVGGAR